MGISAVSARFWTVMSGNFPLWCLYVLLLSVPCCFKIDDYGCFHFAKVRLLTGVVAAISIATVLLCLSVSRKWIKYLTLSLLWALYFLEFFLFLHFGARMSNRVIALVLQTNNEEVGEFFGKYLINRQTLLALTACFVLSCLYFVLRRVWREKLQVLLSASRFLCRSVFLGANVLSAAVICIGLFTDKFYEQLSYPTLEQVAVSLGELRKNDKVISDLEYAMCMTDGHLSGDAPGRIVYVIGESFSRRHSPLYGYAVDTTPRMCQERDSGNLVVFSDVVTPFSSTVHVLNSIFATNDDPEKQWSQPIFPAIFRHAGFKVTLHDMRTTRLIGDLKWDSGNMAFLNSPVVEGNSLDYRNDKVSPFDADFFISEIDSMKKYAWIGTAPSLSIFHMRGQHMPASNRYPDSFRKFSDEDYDFRDDLDSRQKQEVAHYDNATYYNDFCLGLLLDELDGQDAVMIYHSDHGEEVHDYRNNYGRTLEPVSRNIADVIYHVPFVVYTTKEFRMKHPELYRRICQASSRPAILSDMSQMLIGLGGVGSRFYDPLRDMLNDTYDQASGRRILNNEVDYDKLMKQ